MEQVLRLGIIECNPRILVIVLYGGQYTCRRHQRMINHSHKIVTWALVRKLENKRGETAFSNAQLISKTSQGGRKITENKDLIKVKHRAGEHIKVINQCKKRGGDRTNNKTTTYGKI